MKLLRWWAGCVCAGLVACTTQPVVTPKCTANAQCPAGEVCKVGACARAECSGCTASEVCVGGRCLPATCGDRPCRAGEGCIAGRCVSTDCLDVTCKESEACARGQCYPVDCAGGRCESGVCQDGTCVSASCVGVTCPAGRLCADGECSEATCAGVVCGQGAACIDGRCEEVACVGITCSQAGTVCSAGRCVPVACTSGPCADGEVCLDERCVDRRCVGVRCDPGKRCASAACVDCTSREGACSDGIDEDCDGDTDCADADCSTTEGCLCPNGTPDGEPCSDGRICRAGACQTGCWIDEAFRGNGSVSPDNACLACLAATRTGDWSRKKDGTACGDGLLCEQGECVSGCWIDATFFEAGAQNAANLCESCDPSTSTTTWTDRTDGAGCGAAKVCRAGACEGGCFIADAFVAEGTTNPANACQRCEAVVSASAWTDRADGVGCGAGQVCSGAACVAGCFIGGTLRSPDSDDPSDACQACRPATSTSAWTKKSEGAACGAGRICHASTCTAGCLIGGAFVASGTSNPGNPCQRCDPASSTTAWSNLGDGTACGTGQTCNAGVCATGCYIGTTYYANGTVNPANACESCASVVNANAWTRRSDGTACATGQVCSVGACVAGCFIDGAVRADGADNPANACQECVPATSATAWTNKPGGTACGTGQVCNGSTCSGGCWIGGAFKATGADNPANACQECVPATSTTAWTNKAGGTSCGTGQVCNGSTCSSGCWISATFRASGADNPSNACQECVPATSTTAWTSKAGGTSCGTGRVCNGSTCSSGCWISATFRASGADNPSNACQECVPGTSTTAWTNKAGGTSCGTGRVCNGSTCSSGCWISGVFRASGADNPSNACQECVPATRTTGWTNKAQGSGCGTNRYCCSGTCVAKNATAHCGACGVDCSKALGSCRQQASGGYSCYCNTNASCRSITGADATCWTSSSNPPGPNNCQCQCPGNVSGCLGQCPNGAKCAEASGNGNYCYY